MKPATVAVVGAGPTGLSMLKTLTADGFKTTLFERRDRVGGLWAYSSNPAYTSALKRTTANISKFTCGFTDYPIADRFSTWLSSAEYQDFMEGYAKHFDLHKNIAFNTTVKKVSRDAEDANWILDLETDGASKTAVFDKVVFCHGPQTRANVPVFEGQEGFKGIRMHAQQYRTPDQFKGKKVVVIGLSATASDVLLDITPHASKVYVSHRRGAVPVSRDLKGTPSDLLVSWRRRMINQWAQKNLPRLHQWCADYAVNILAPLTSPVKIDPAWRLTPFPSPLLRLTGVFSETLRLLDDGSVTSLQGIKRFVGDNSIEFADGTVIDDVDAVISCTGYTADFSLAPFIEESKPTGHDYAGGPLKRLYMNLFPPRYADSCAVVCHSTYGKNNGFSFADVISMALSNVWTGVSADMVPSQAQMEEWIEEQHAWVASRWAMEHAIDLSMVRQYVFQGWLHEAAGTGMENLGWGWKGWKFWMHDRKMYNLMNNGVETAHMFRYFETGKRATWPGARDEIIHQNELVKQLSAKKKATAKV